MPIDSQKMLDDQQQKEDGAVADASIEMTEDQAELQRQDEAIVAMRVSMMDAVGANLESLFAEAVQFRSDYEREWAQDIRQFETGETLDVSNSKQHASASTGSSTDDWKRVNDNITRAATITYAARLSDMLYPTSDRNWDIDHTPDPELPPEVVANIEAGLREIVASGKMTEEKAGEAIDQLIIAVAKKRVGKMRSRIDDQLLESRYNDQGREIIMHACKIGHGVIKGPFPKSKRRRRYTAGQGYKARTEEILTDPVVVSVDPWMVYPRPCRRIEDCPGVFELHELSAKRVDALKIQPGFSESQVGRILKVAPSWSSVLGTLTTLRQIDDASLIARNENYAFIEYNGEMPREAVLVFIEQLAMEAKIDDEQRAQLLEFVQESNAVHLNCNVWFCQGIVAKVAVSPIDHEGSLYKFFAFERHESAPFGKGVPRILRDAQASVRQLWAAMHLNAMMSAAPQIGIIKGALEAEGGGAQGVKDLRFTKPRVWSFTGEVDDIRKAMQVFAVPNTVAGVLPIYERAKQNGLEQAMMPQIAQGEPTQSVQTSSGLAMLMNASNIVQRRLAAEFDACITTPLITAMYEWNMEFGPDEAKGDFNIVARASSHLLVKDIQAQHFMTALTMYANHPKLEPRMRWDAWAEEGMKILDMSASRFLLTDEEFEAAAAEQAKAQPQQDPNVIRAEAAMLEAQTRQSSAQTNAQIAQGKLSAQQEDRALDFEDRIADRETRERIAAAIMQGQMASLDADAQGRVMEMQATMTRDADRNATQTRIAGMKAAEKAQELAMKERLQEREIQIESPNPRLG